MKSTPRMKISRRLRGRKVCGCHILAKRYPRRSRFSVSSVTLAHFPMNRLESNIARMLPLAKSAVECWIARPSRRWPSLLEREAGGFSPHPTSVTPVVISRSAASSRGLLAKWVAGICVRVTRSPCTEEGLGGSQSTEDFYP